MVKGLSIRLKTAVILLVLGTTLLTAIPLQWVWWRTSRATSLALVDVLSQQITATVQREWWDNVASAESAHRVAASLLDAHPTEATVSRALTASLASSQVPSAMSFDDKQIGSVVARRDIDGKISVSTIRGAKRPIDSAPNSSPPASISSQSGWREVAVDAGSQFAAVAFQGQSETTGALSVYIGMDRFSDLLGAILVGQTGSAFVVDRTGQVKIAPTQASSQALMPVAGMAAKIVEERPQEAYNIVETRRLEWGDKGYRVSFSPLEFKSWQLVIVVPEAEFLSEIEATTLQALVGLIGLSALLGLAAAAIAQRVLSEPVSALGSDLAKIQRFEVEDISQRFSHLVEFDQLSTALTRMAAGLSDFGKFIPTDLVRTLIADGVRAVPGGETRQLTVMFADVVGFTKISERMGTGVIEVISGYLDLVSRTVESHGGTVDKYLGDAVMALWGAPRPDVHQARNACQAALNAVHSVQASGILDDRGEPLRMRIGLHSGVAVVGNIGSRRRLNYTAIGDTVNLTSRLEGANKVFGTSVLISEETKVAAGAAFLTRELAVVSVLGRTKPIRIFELLGDATMSDKPSWAIVYEQALEAYRQRHFTAAIRLLKKVRMERPDDGPAEWLSGVCHQFRDVPPPKNWNAVVQLSTK